jgi:hypothetical protein
LFEIADSLGSLAQRVRPVDDRGDLFAVEKVAQPHQVGALRPGATSGDVGVIIVRLTRPLPGGFPAETNNSLGHRHLDLLIDGLRPTARPPARLDGPALNLADLRQFTQPRSSAPESKAPAAMSPPSHRGIQRRRAPAFAWRRDGTVHLFFDAPAEAPATRGFAASSPPGLTGSALMKSLRRLASSRAGSGCRTW